MNTAPKDAKKRQHLVQGQGSISLFFVLCLLCKVILFNHCLDSMELEGGFLNILETETNCCQLQNVEVSKHLMGQSASTFTASSSIEENGE